MKSSEQRVETILCDSFDVALIQPENEFIDTHAEMLYFPVVVEASLETNDP